MLDEIDRLRAERAVERRIRLYARAVDRADWQAVRDCYTADAVDDHGGYKGGVAGLVEDMEHRHRAIASSVHVVTNIVVDVTDEDSAVSEAYCLAFQTFVNEQGRRVVQTSCRYLDRLAREADDEWRIAARVVAYDWAEECWTPDVAPAAAARSARDASDPLWALVSEGCRDQPRTTRAFG